MDDDARLAERLQLAEASPPTTAEGVKLSAVGAKAWTSGIAAVNSLHERKAPPSADEAASRLALATAGEWAGGL